VISAIDQPKVTPPQFSVFTKHNPEGRPETSETIREKAPAFAIDFLMSPSLSGYIKAITISISETDCPLQYGDSPARSLSDTDYFLVSDHF
jgi:hypothetical protein